jgi:hypothetical protein
MKTPLVRACLLAVAASTTLGLAGCYTYPPGYYRPATVQRLTPEQVAAIQGNAQLTQADRDRLSQANAQVAQQEAAPTYAPAYGPAYAPAPAYYDDPYYYGYPYAWGAYPFYPAIGLSFGFRGGCCGYFHGGGFRGGFHGRR